MPGSLLALLEGNPELELPSEAPAYFVHSSIMSSLTRRRPRYVECGQELKLFRAVWYKLQVTNGIGYTLGVQSRSFTGIGINLWSDTGFIRGLLRDIDNYNYSECC